MEIEIEKTSAHVNIDRLPQVWGIPSQLRQVFQNLISNAIKFQKKDEIPLVHIYSEVSKKDILRIVVQDNGIGFESKYAEEIFMVFKRLHSYHEFQGSGVGLSICKKIIEKHNGSIRAESQPGVGSRFIVDIPLVELTPQLSQATSEKAKAV
jgi:light-regulated signal transduction histidine kinase (bacteriophytochrome)